MENKSFEDRIQKAWEESQQRKAKMSKHELEELKIKSIHHANKVREEIKTSYILGNKKAIDEIRNIIKQKSYYNYESNFCSKEEMFDFEQRVKRELGFKLDFQYYDFLQELNGFELNGLNFYSTKEQQNVFLYDTIERNIFWHSELEKLANFYILGDGDMDFYCFSPLEGKYLIFDKGGLLMVRSFDSFNDLMNEVILIYS